MTSQLTQTPEDFCRGIANEVAAGRGIVPLLGAGISATSGIPTRPELMAYLEVSVSLALGLECMSGHQWIPWSPQSGRWPPMRGDWRRIGQTGTRLLKRILTSNAWLRGKEEQKFTRFRELCQEAYGSLADWRSALQFLARLRVQPGQEKPTSSAGDAKSFKERVQEHATWAYGAIVLGDPNEHVIDSFFNHIVSGKVPSMSHNMVANLIGPLRTKVILTLNFDELLEKALRQSGIELSPFEVHHEAGIPPWSLLGNETAIIKLRGGRYGLRADFSLDKAPTELDRSHFCSYLAGADIAETTRQQNIYSQKLVPRFHLLVAGVSGQDRRVRLLVLHALRTFNDSLRVFWCCFSEQDAHDLDEHFQAFQAQVIGVRHVHLGLLFWEIYQTVTYSLPPSGLEFPTTWRIPAPPSLVKEEISTLLKRVHNKLEESNTWFKKPSRRPGLILECPIPTAADKGSQTLSGISALSWELFKRWNGPNRCVWLDAEDIADASQLKDYLIQAITFKVGLDFNKPAISGSMERFDDEAFAREIKDLLQTSSRPWILFVNLRGSPGYAANSFVRLSLRPRNPSMSRDEWIATRRKEWEWSPGTKREIQEFLNRICARLRKFLSIVVIRDEGTFPLNPNLFHGPIRVEIPQSTEYRHWAKKRAKAGIDWIKAAHDQEQRIMRARLLRAITLFQQVRHHTALVSRAVLQLRCEPEQWKTAWQNTRCCIDALVERKIVRHKAGGFLWMHWEIREHLRAMLEELGDVTPDLEGVGGLHRGIADWHMTFFHATNDPRAVFQAVYHRCWIARLALEGKRTPHDFVAARGALCEASNHLGLARAQILALGHHNDTRSCLKDFISFLTTLAASERDRLSPNHVAEHFASERNLRFLQMVKVKMQLYRISFERDVGRSDYVIKGCLELFQWFKKWKKIESAQGKSLFTRYLEEWGEEAFWNTHFLKLEWSIVAISLRDYDTALIRLNSILADFDFPITELLGVSNDNAVWQVVDHWIEKMGRPEAKYAAFRYSLRRFVFHLLRRYMETLLLKEEMTKTLKETEDDPKNDRRAYLYQAQRLYLAAQMLPRYVTEEENSLLHIEHSRLHSVMAGVLAVSGDYEGVHRQINEARVALASLPESEDSIARAVLDLRAIFCKFAELRSIRRLRQLRNNVVAGYAATVAELEADGERVRGILDDIKSLLNRVEARLVSYRKSLWWWMTMCRYRMKWIETSMLVLGVAEREVPPDAFQNSNLQSLSEDAEALMSDVCIRTTFDSVQMARILNDFVNVVRYRHRFTGDIRPEVLRMAVKRLKEVQAAHKRALKRGSLKWLDENRDFVERITDMAGGALKDCAA